MFETILFTLLGSALLTGKLKAQSNNVGIQLFLPAVHLSEGAYLYGKEYSYKLDKKGKYVALPGVKTYTDIKLQNTLLSSKELRIGAAYYKDCMNQSSGVIHLGLRWEFPATDNFHFGTGLGPTLFFENHGVNSIFTKMTAPSLSQIIFCQAMNISY